MQQYISKPDKIYIMKVFFDARYIEPDFHNGISRYTAKLGSALSKKWPITFIISDLNQLKLLPKNSNYILIHPPTSVREPLTSLILNKHNPDIVFSPMQTMGSFGKNFKLILTLHDLIYYKHRTPPTNLNSAIRLGWWLYHLTYTPGRIVLNKADVVATVSQTTKSEFEDVKIAKRPVKVIANAADDLSSLTNKKINLDKNPRNLVYMGSFMPYKNVETLIEGLSHLPNDYTLHLLSRINPKRQKELEALIPKGKKVVFHNGVSDKEYANILADNAIMVSASKSEGFGLPLIEAINIGVPCVVSDMEIFHEVAGSGALYFTGPKDFASKIKQLESSTLRKDLVKKGKLHTKNFSWDKSASELLDTMTSLTTV